MVEINKTSRRYLSKVRTGHSYAGLGSSPSRHPEKLEFLRIPLSIHRVYYENFEPLSFKHRSRDFLPSVFWEWIQPGEKEYLDLLIRLVGHGTRTLYKLTGGDVVNAIGPLGKEIDFPADLDNAILISGGVGLASLYPVAHHLRERGYRVILFAGAHDLRTLEDSSGEVLPDFTEMGVECHVTDEIKHGRFVTDLVSEWFSSAESAQLSGRSHIYSCGPWPMLKEVHNISNQLNFPCTVLVDKMMLCGVGACMSCVVRIHDRQNSSTDLVDRPTKMVCSCVDGPAFDSRDIVWEEELTKCQSIDT
jgi:dihydroorotate dehydrogenase electron transfer subunit